jgi:hypothetical protein
VHKAILVYQFLAEKQIQMLKPVPYSHQILLHATFLFPELKNSLRRTHLQSAEDMHEKMA